MDKHIVVVGGGIAGLLSAYIYSLKSDYTIYLVEKSENLGGLLKCFDYGEFGKFDYGAHNILESGIDELDSLLLKLLEEDEWTVSSAVNGQKRALTGIYYNGILQENSPFIDLRKENNLDELKIDFLSNIEENNSIDYSTAYDYSISIFGQKITNEYINPIFQSLYGVEAKEMDYMAMFLTPLTRVGLFNTNIMNDLLSTKVLSRNLAYPNQKILPSKYFGTKKTYYPKNYGIYRVIEKLEHKLRENGVKIHLNTTVESLKLDNNKIIEMKINNEKISELKTVVWSAGLGSVKQLLNIKTKEIEFQKPPRTAITNILIDQKLTIGDMSYIYNYDKNFQIFRIDNYSSYCENAKRNGFYPISVEMLVKDGDMCEESINKVALQELESFGVLEKNTKIGFSKTEILEYGFPFLSKNNIEIFDNTRNAISKLNIKNLTLIGVLANKDLFFESDIKKDLYYKIKELLNDN
ncbi:MAG TPA: hypothetical protein ENI82_00935 [Bacteroidetes bacterium]|nr:hypothetical protein [Bacteroidota bacterium]